MAEGLLRDFGGGRFEVFSAGTEATMVRPLAIRVMHELGVDISGQQSKTLERYLDHPFDSVITVCDQANEACPVFFGARERLHWSFPDPSKAMGTEDERLSVYRDVRDSIRDRIEGELLAVPHRSSMMPRPATVRIPARQWPVRVLPFVACEVALAAASES